MTLTEIFITVILTFIISAGFGFGSKLFVYLLQKVDKHKDKVNFFAKRILISLIALVVGATLVTLAFYLGVMSYRYEQIVNNSFLKWVIQTFPLILLVLGCAPLLTNLILSAINNVTKRSSSSK